MTENQKVAVRLREFGVGTFGSVTAFARALGVSVENLSSYLSARSRPGNKMQARLRELGCDIEWLMTGKVSGDSKKKAKEDAFVAFHAPAGISDEMKRAVQKLIDGLADLEPDDVESVRKIVKEAFKKKK